VKAEERDMSALRAAIADVDEKLIALVAERARLAREIGEAKRRAGLPALDPAREATVVRLAAERARAAGLDDEAIRDLYWRLIGLCRGEQQRERRA
jgi:chorismate mutase